MDSVSLSGTQLLQFAYNLISDAVREVSGRFIMIECHNEKSLMDFYESKGFFMIDNISDEGTVLVQMLRRIK